jgi:hypothetical protein
MHRNNVNKERDGTSGSPKTLFSNLLSQDFLMFLRARELLGEHSPLEVLGEDAYIGGLPTASKVSPNWNGGTSFFSCHSVPVC